MRRYNLVAPARTDLTGIREYLAEAPNPIQSRILSSLREAFNQIARFPGIGRFEPEFPGDSGLAVRSIALAPYRIYYHPDTDPVTILAIIHGAQDIPSILSNRLSLKQ